MSLLKLLPLTLAGFIAIMTETMPDGLLPQISKSLDVKASLAGQLITVYAFGSLLAAIPIITATLHWNRKHLLLSALAGFLVFNAITALSTNYIITLTVRFLAGIGAGIIWSLLVGYTLQIVPSGMEGKALALVGIGQPVALALGVPAATWLGQKFGLAGVFWIMSLLSLLLAIWSMFCLPGIPGTRRQKKSSILTVLKIDGIRHVLFVTCIWIIAHNLLYTYIAPFLAVFGMAEKVDLILFIFGIASVIGIVIIGVLIDKWLPLLVRVSLLVFAIGAVLLLLGVISPAFIYTGVFLWGLSLGGIATLLQKDLADYAGEHADVSQSMMVTVFNLAIAIGGILGGVLLDHIGAKSFPWAVLVLIVLVFFSLTKRRMAVNSRSGARQLEGLKN